MFFLIILWIQKMKILNFKTKFLIILSTIFYCTNSFGLNINESVQSTIEKNNKVKIALEQLNESKELIENAIGKKLPSVTSTISGTYSNSDKKTTTGDTTPETFTDKYKITVTQNLFDYGFKDLEIERSKILYQNELINFKKTIQDLSLNAISGYLTVINDKKLLQVNKKNFDSVKRFLEETKTRYTLGSATLYELQNSQSAFAIAETNLFIAEQNYNLSKKTFKNIVGKDAINLEEVIKFDKELNFDEIIQNIIENNFDITLLENDIINKKILLSKEKKSNKPNLDLSASAEYSDAGRIDSGTESTNASIGLTLTVPIFNQNIDKSNIRKYNSQILQAELQLEDFKDDIEIQASNLYKEFLISKSNMSSNLIVIKSIETSLQSISEEFKLGTKSITDLIDAETDLLDSNVKYFASRKEYILNYFNILSLQGSIIEIFEDYLPKFN